MTEEKKPEPKNFIKLLVPPHNGKSREVGEAELTRVVKDAHILFQLCYTKIGVFNGGKAIAHSQITTEDPLRFFVTKDEEIIINPVVIKHTRHTVDSSEGCLTFPSLPPCIIQRWNKCEVEYNILTKDLKLSKRVAENLSGLRAKVFQHEIDHFDGLYVYKYNKKTDGKFTAEPRNP